MAFLSARFYTYDNIGNPLNDGTWTYTWEKGRQIKSMSKSGTTASFKYNEKGLRIQKTGNGVVTNYTLHGKNIMHMTQGSNSLHFYYDASNKPAIVELMAPSMPMYITFRAILLPLLTATALQW